MQLAATPRLESHLAPVAALGGVLTAAGLAWVFVVERMAGMATGPGGDPGALGWFALTWAAMTAAMMLPAAAPAIWNLGRTRGAGAPAAAVLFIGGYGVVWMLAGLAGYAVVEAIRGLQITALGWSSAGRFVAGATIAGAGLYQLSALKRRWLARCTSPQLHRFQGSLGGPVRAGLEHGICCVACCWTLMVALYALGMMSVAWMALVTILIAGERLTPRPVVAVRTVAAVMLVLGIGVALWPGAVPGLTAHRPGHAMTMGMRGPA